MMSYLDDYDFSRSNSIPKFKRAVQSFLDQDFENKELVIIADGCEITKSIYEKYFSNNDSIRFFWTNKSLSRWPGELRQAGADLANGDWICYLDADDCIRSNHLSKIADSAKDSKSKILLDTNILVPFVDDGSDELTLIRSTIDRNFVNKRQEEGKIFDFPFKHWEDPAAKVIFVQVTVDGFAGTWQISHAKEVTNNIKWGNSNELFGGEDKGFIETATKMYEYNYITTPGTYTNCHAKNMDKDKRGLDI